MMTIFSMKRPLSFFLILTAMPVFTGCVQSGKRFDEIDQSVAVMNQRIDELNEKTAQEIERRKEILNLIQQDLQPIAQSSNFPTPTPAPEASPTPIVLPNDIQSKPIENTLSPSFEDQTQAVTKMDEARELFQQKSYARAAYLFYEIYLDDHLSETLREDSLFFAGESFFFNQDWNQTIDTFIRFFQAYPNSEYLPKSLRYTAQSYEQLGQTQRAESVYEYLKKHVPQESP